MFVVYAGNGGLGGAFGLTFGPDGNLYVTAQFFTAVPGVLRYNGTTGAFMDVFVAGQFNVPAFGPDGHLYVGFCLSGIPASSTVKLAFHFLPRAKAVPSLQLETAAG